MEEIKNDIQNDIVVVDSVQEPTEQNIIEDIVKEEYRNRLQEVKNDKEFQKRVQEVVGITSATALRTDLLKALNQEQKNELLQYQIECEKDKLAYRKRHEKKVIREEARAEVQEKKINALKKRFGYLYDTDEHGNPKRFVASKFVNRYKEICNWYDGTSQGFKKIVTATLRIAFYAGLVYLAYKGLIWASVNLPTIIETNGTVS